MNLSRTLSLLFCLSGIASASAAESWPQFLGPQRNGISVDKTVLVEKFSEDGPAQLWKFPAGAGFAGPVVSGGRVYFFHRVENEARVDCLDAVKGTAVWKTGYQTEYQDQFGFDEGPRSSPTVADGRVFTYGAEGKVQALDAATGKRLWLRDMAEDFGSEQGFFGRAGAPLVVGQVVMVNAGGPKAAAVGLDVASGKTVWKAGDQAAGYASPVLWNTARGPCVIFWLREGLLGVGPADGKVWFEVPCRSTMDASVNAATPVIVDGERFLTTACYGTGATLWKLTAEGIASAWRAGDKLDAHYATPIFSDGFLYGMHGRQETGQELRCIEAATGREKWSSGKFPVSDLISADGKLILVTEKGELILVKRSLEEFAILDRAQILGATHRSPPALSGGVLYARDKKQLVAVRLAK